MKRLRVYLVPLVLMVIGSCRRGEAKARTVPGPAPQNPHVTLAPEPLVEKEQFTLAIQTNTHAEALANGIGAAPQDSAEGVHAEARGEERSDPGGGEERHSAGAASASVRRDAIGPESLSATMTVASTSNGGHLVRCSAQVLGNCVGRNGEDTQGSSDARATFTTRITFAENARVLWYDLDLAGHLETGGATLVVTLTDPDGAEHVLHSQPAIHTRITSKRGATYLLSLTLSAGSSDRGGSGSAAKQGVVPFALAVRRSAILAAEAIHDTTLTAAGDEARIVGGEETHDYPAVGAILQNGLMHCTGTLIGPHTVLTAGHCLYKRETRDLVFVQGTYALDQGNIRRRATAKAMPNDGDFRYDDPSLHDDVGLLYVGDPAATETMKLHVGEPPLRDLVKHQRELAFIGFGYTLVRGNKAGLGTKRHVDMPINGFAARTFTYRVARKNTCNGDSGGPAFVESANELWLAGITSSGDTPCTDHGTDTRVESFMSWISPRIR